MPPDITAGLMALAGPLPPAGPPGAASPGTPAAALGSVSAALFASLLTQSSPPSLIAAPKTAALPVKLGLDAKPLPSNTLTTLGTLKITEKAMDTLPTLSFLLAGTAAKAGELLPSSPTGHKAGADDTATDASQNAVDLTTATANALNAAPGVVPIAVPVQAALLPVQAALLPVLTPAAAPAPSRASEIAAPSVSRLSSVPRLDVPNSSLALGGSPQPPSTPLIALVPASLQPVSLPLPQVPPLPAGVPQMAEQVASQEKPVPEKAVPAVSVPTSAKTIAGLPQELLHSAALGPVTLGPVTLSQAVPAQPLSPGQAAPFFPPSIPNQAVPNAPSTAALGTFVQPAAAALPVAAPVLLSSGPAKPLAKTTQIALKPTPANADTYTGIADAGMEANPALTAKSVLPAKLPDPGSQSSVPEKTGGARAEAKAPVGTLEAGTLEAGTLTAAQAAPPQAGLTGRPLSAADQIKIVHQVADGVGAMPLPAKPGGVQQMSLQLHPKDWGSLQMSVSVTAGPQAGSQKNVTAHIVAETPQVKAALQSQTGALHQALRASGLNLEHLTVSVKPAAETVKPAAQSASAGFSGGQGQPNTGSNQAQPPHMAASSQSAGMQLGTSAGSSQNGRQGQPPAFAPASAQAEAQPEELPLARLPIRPAAGRIDTHA